MKLRCCRSVVVLTMALMSVNAVAAPDRKGAPPPPPPAAVVPEVTVNAAPPVPVGPLSEVRITLKGNDLPLGAILGQIARSAQLALVAEKEVKMESVVPQSSLENLKLQSALAVILTPFGYGYSIDERAGELRIVVFETRTFKLGVPVIAQQWDSSVSNGGGVAAPGAAAPGAAAPAAGAVGAPGGATGGMGATVSLKTKTDATGGLWAELEASLGKLVGEGGSFSANRVGGFVTVRALPSHMHAVAEYLQTVGEEMRRSIIVETKVIQVDLNKDRAVGIDWTLVGKALSNVGITLSGGIVSNFPAMAGAPSTFQLSGALGTSFIQALETQGDLHMIAQPNLVLGNNLPAIINVSTVEKYVSGITTTLTSTGTAQTSVQTDTISDGLVMSVLPRVMEDGAVQLAVSMVSQDFLGFSDVTVSKDVSLKLPKTAQRAYSGVVSARVGQSIVIGGMLSDKNNDASKGVPFLARLPLIGWIFGYQGTTNKRTELVVAITVREVGDKGIVMQDAR